MLLRRNIKWVQMKTKASKEWLFFIVVVIINVLVLEQFTLWNIIYFISIQIVIQMTEPTLSDWLRHCVWSTNRKFQALQCFLEMTTDCRIARQRKWDRTRQDTGEGRVKWWYTIPRWQEGLWDVRNSAKANTSPLLPNASLPWPPIYTCRLHSHTAAEMRNNKTLQSSPTCSQCRWAHICLKHTYYIGRSILHYWGVFLSVRVQWWVRRVG